MARVIEVTGAREIRRRLKRANVTLGSAVERGLKRAGLFLQRESQEVVPVATGALKNSAGTRAEGKGWNTDVIVFYLQGYAVYVHERMDLRHKPGKQAKFLEGPAREKKDRILAIIAGED